MNHVSIRIHRPVAYFCMEVSLGDPNIPTYSGGLGVLAGDTLRSAADLGVPMVGMTLLYRQGHFRQRLDSTGIQRAEPEVWRPEGFLEQLVTTVEVPIEGRPVKVRAWRLELKGVNQHTVPIYFLDTDLPHNSPADRALTGQLYGGDQRYRLSQEAILGLGGVAILKMLGHEDVAIFHMNEGHSALLSLALLADHVSPRPIERATDEDIEATRSHCVFTTHTPVPAAADQFPWALVEQVLGKANATALQRTGCCHGDSLNMTYLALRCSRYINGVAMKHGEVSRGMFPRYPINSITNGVHAVRWTSEPFAQLYDEHIPQWRQDNLYLRYAVGIPVEAIQDAHALAKRQLLGLIQKRQGRMFNESVLTIGFGRRAAAYKRPDLLFADVDRLRRIAERLGGLQVIYAGKAHPADEGGKAMIRRVFEAARRLGDTVPVVYLENYDAELARNLTAGVDLWLNTPHKPDEASGTSGMKAAINGVPSLSVLDGWWIEGHVEGVTGWAIGESVGASDQAADAASLYDKLDRVIGPLYYGHAEAFGQIMRHCIALNGSFYNSQRMVAQYVTNAYATNTSGVPVGVQEVAVPSPS